MRLFSRGFSHRPSISKKNLKYTIRAIPGFTRRADKRQALMKDVKPLAHHGFTKIEKKKLWRKWKGTSDPFSRREAKRIIKGLNKF